MQTILKKVQITAAVMYLFLQADLYFLFNFTVGHTWDI